MIFMTRGTMPLDDALAGSDADFGIETLLAAGCDFDNVHT